MIANLVKLTFCFLASNVLFTVGVSAQESTALEVGKRIEKSIGGEEVHHYHLDLDKDQFVYATLLQKGIDLIITAFDPRGRKIQDFDSPNGINGEEPIILISESAGQYRLEVKQLEPGGENNSGHYTLEVLHAKTAATTREGKVDQLMVRWDRSDSPGASIAIVKEGKVLYQKGYGMANLEYDIANQPQTIFHIASVSKQFTTFAIAMLADQGKLSLDDDIRKYLPEVPDFGQPITIRHLAHHTSGMRDQWNLLSMAGWRFDDVITKEHVLKLVADQKELNFQPGEEYLYCNTGFTLMAEIVARISGKTFAEWTDEHIFQPLEMSNTLFYDDHEKIVRNRAYSYSEGADGYKKSVLSYANAGATSLFTTVEDLSKWATNFETLELGNQRIMDQMHTRGILNNGDTISYALGQVIGTYKGLRTVSHGGADAGYRTYLVRFPDQKTSISVFSNLANFSPGQIAYDIADIYLAGNIVEEEKEETKEKEATIETAAITLTPEVLEQYVGRYRLAPGVIVTFTNKNNQLMAQATGQTKFPLMAISEHVFAANQIDVKITFQLSADGQKAEIATLFQDGNNIEMPRIADFDPSLVNLEDFIGTYYSSELRTTYEIVRKEGKLLARHQRHPNIHLRPIHEDEFSGDQWFMGQIRFVRDKLKAVTGFKVSNGRVRNLIFTKSADH